jgi:hypothetical protein
MVFIERFSSTYRRALAWAGLGCAGFFFSCSDASGPRTSTQSTHAPKAEVTPRSPQEITVATDPNASCTLYTPDRKTSMRVWPDDIGIVHLWAPWTSETYVVECNEAGTTVQHALDLGNAATFQPAIPRKQRAPRSVLPAITNPLAKSQTELMKAGYPPRPDPVRAAPLYQKWLKTVSVPLTVVSPKLVERRDVSFDPPMNYGRTNWSGLALAKPSTRYVLAAVDLTVPEIMLPENTPVDAKSQVSFWGGLDGLPYWTPIIQAGIDYFSVGSVGTYAVWYEYYSIVTPWAIFDSAMPVAPGDDMQFAVWECDASMTVGGHGYGCFLYVNNTTGSIGFRQVEAPPPPFNTFVGATAEAVAERASYAPPDPLNFPLTNFGYQTLVFDALDSTGAHHSFSSDPYYNISMVTFPFQTLASATKVDPNTVGITWLAPGP